MAFNNSFQIGGEFGIGLKYLLKPALRPKKQKWGHRYHLYLDTGRSAIYVALTEILRRGGTKKAWLPRYCCESVILPFKQLGFEVSFYSLGDNLQSIEYLPQNIAGTTFLYIHYFGMTNRPVIEWLDKVSKSCKNFFVIEDCVQALLNKDVGKYGDFSVYSLRKFLPQPDGAILSSNLPTQHDLAQPDEGFVSRKIIGKLLREYAGPEAIFLEAFRDAEQKLDNVVCPRAMSWISKYLLDRADFYDVSLRRRKNWSYLLGLLRAEGLLNNSVSLMFEHLEECEVPLGLPIKIDERYRDSLLAFLMQNNVYCPVHWKIQASGNSRAWKKEISLSKSILTMPLDQRLNYKALEYSVGKIKLFYTRYGRK